MGVFKSHEISYEKRLEIVFYKSKGKTYNKTATIRGYSKSTAFTVCKKFFKSRIVKHLLWVGRSEKFTKIFDCHATLPVLESLMWVHNYAFISG